MLVRLVEQAPDYPGNRVLVQTLSYSADETRDTGRYRKTKEGRALKVVQQNCSDTEVNEFRDLLSHITTDELEYVARAFVEHSRLSEEERAERRAIIENTILDIMGPRDEEAPEQSLQHRMIGHMGECAFLYPTVCLEITCRVFCRDQLRALPQEYLRLGVQRKLALLQPFYAVDREGVNRKVVEDFVSAASAFLNYDELAATGEAVAAVLTDQYGYLEHMQALFLTFLQVHQPSFMRRRGQALRAMVGQDFDDYKERLDDLWAEANEEHERYYAAQLRIVHSLIDNELPTPALAANQMALLETLRITAEEEARAVVEAVRVSVEQETEQAAALRQAETQRIIGMVLAEIEEEPRPRPRRGGTRKKQKKKPQKGRNQRTRNTPQTTTEIEDITVVETDAEQNRLQGLRQYFDFVSYELGTLLTRIPEGVDGAEDVNQAITGWRSDITALLEGEDPDLDQWTTVARACDQYLAQVRRDIRVLIQQVAETTNFENSLRLAIQRETVSYGRNFGGELRRGLENLSWSDVSVRFHNWYLSGQGQIEQGGVTRLLAPDEALALYVTMSSRSGYDFDISCHYWRRRPGSSAPPVDDDGFMNVMDWYDTYVPCFVLHVPK